MVTTWPKNFPGLGTGVNQLAAQIGAMSGGRVQVEVYGAGELVPAAEVFAAVGRGTVEMGHGCASYWSGRCAAVPFFSSIPFGMTAQEVNAWLYHGGGQALWDEAYAPFGVVPAAVGNTGVNMGGWFNKEIRSAADLPGLKLGLSGLGGEVLARAGGTPIKLPPDALLMALQSGVIDGAEWVGPYADLALGLYAAAKYYYYPGWHGWCRNLRAAKGADSSKLIIYQFLELAFAGLRPTDCRTTSQPHAPRRGLTAYGRLG
jgi:TRAP-type mannitol/chloroaromatic compound transport system substrate-binding protein